jgi:hypothetical protein
MFRRPGRGHTLTPPNGAGQGNSIVRPLRTVAYWTVLALAAWALAGVGVGIFWMIQKSSYVNDVMIAAVVLLLLLCGALVLLARRIKRTSDRGLLTPPRSPTRFARELVGHNRPNGVGGHHSRPGCADSCAVDSGLYRRDRPAGRRACHRHGVERTLGLPHRRNSPFASRLVAGLASARKTEIVLGAPLLRLVQDGTVNAPLPRRRPAARRAKPSASKAARSARLQRRSARA